MIIDGNVTLVKETVLYVDVGDGEPCALKEKLCLVGREVDE